MKCECCGHEITRNDRTDKCPKCGRMRCVRCDLLGEPCAVCRAKEDADTGNPDPVCADCGSDLDIDGNCVEECEQGGDQ